MWWSILPSFALTMGFVSVPGLLADRFFRFILYNDKPTVRDTFDATDFQLSHRDYYIMGSRYVRRGINWIPEVD